MELYLHSTYVYTACLLNTTGIFTFAIFLESKLKLSSYRYAGVKEERKYSSSLLTLAVDGGEWSASRHFRALPPDSSVPTV
jgi:hypothetical protein